MPKTKISTFFFVTFTFLSLCCFGCNGSNSRGNNGGKAAAKLTNLAQSVRDSNSKVSTISSQSVSFQFPQSRAIVPVTSQAELTTAIANAAVGDVVELSNDIILTATVTVGAGKDITIRSSSDNLFKLEGNDTFGIIDNSGTLILEHLIITKGKASNGGGVSNTGTMTMNNCSLTANTADVVNGGGVINGGTMTMNNCVLSANTAPSGDGGGVANNGTMIMTNCTLSANSANSANDGGGVHNSGTMTMDNCTLSANSANDGGGVRNEVTMTMTNCTLSVNSANDGGGALNFGTMTMTNCIVANNTAGTGPDIADFATITATNNLVEDVNGHSVSNGVGGNTVVPASTPDWITPTFYLTSAAFLTRA